MNIRGERILIFGDSLTHHGHDSGPEIWNVDAGSSRSSSAPGDLLASMLLERGAAAVRTDARVGRSAMNFYSRENAKQLLADDIAWRPTKVIVMLGTNDIGRSPDGTRTAMTAIRDTFKGAGAEVWAIGPPLFVSPSEGLNGGALQIIGVMKSVFGGRFVDARYPTEQAGALANRAKDGVHFTTASARPMAETLASTLSTKLSPTVWWTIGAIAAGAGGAYVAWRMVSARLSKRRTAADGHKLGDIGALGAKTRKRSEELFVRFGEWHPNERSRNYARGGSEDGVSVYDVAWRSKEKRWDVRMPAESDNPHGPEDTFWTLLKKAEAGEDPVFILKGDVVGVGHDGEPLIRNIRVVKKVDPKDLVSSDLRWVGSKKTLGDKLGGPRLDGHIPGASKLRLEIADYEAVDALREAAKNGERFGGRKVFLSSIVDMKDPQTRRVLLALQRDGLIELTRADLVAAMDPKLVKASELPADGATYHFLVDDQGSLGAPKDKVPIKLERIVVHPKREWPRPFYQGYTGRNVTIPDRTTLHTTQHYVSSSLVNEKVKAIRAGQDLRVELARDNQGRLWIVDGHHTLAAYHTLQRTPRAFLYDQGTDVLVKPPRFRSRSLGDIDINILRHENKWMKIGSMPKAAGYKQIPCKSGLDKRSDGVFRVRCWSK